MTHSTDVARSSLYLRRHLTLLASCRSVVGLADTKGVHAYVDKRRGINPGNVPDHERRQVLITAVVAKNVPGYTLVDGSNCSQRDDDVIGQTASRCRIDEALLKEARINIRGFREQARHET